jgi:Domain of unknown function (DUF4404)
MYTPVRAVATRAQGAVRLYWVANLSVQETGQVPMRQPDLHELLAGLHDELKAAQSVDQPTRQELQHLAAEIRAVLDEGSGLGAAARYRGLRERLRRAVTAFEASHPQLARRIEGTIDALAMLNL